MEDNQVKALRDLISDYRVEHRADSHMINERMGEILLLLKGHPDDPNNPGLIARIIALEDWKKKRLESEYKLKVWGAAVAGVGGLALGIFKWIQSIMK